MSRFLTALFVATLALTTLPHAANAQAWPTKPIRIIVPFAPGGAIDVRSEERRVGKEC